MAGLVQDIFEEHLSVITALKDNYARHDDAHSVATIKAIHNELAELCSVRETEVKKAIQSLSNNVARSKQAAVYPGPAEAHATAVAGIKSTTADAIENISQLNAQLAELRQQQEDLREKYKQLQVHSDKIEQRVADLEPRTRHELSLYAHISKIVWKFNQSDRIAGMVSDKAHGDIRSFDYDITQLPPAEVVNKLWDIIAGLEENVQTL